MSDYISRADAIEAVVAWTVEDRPHEVMPTDLVDRIKALPSADALLKQEIDFHKEVSRIEAEKVVDLEHKLANAVQGEWGHMMIDGNKLMLALSEWWYSSFGLEETEESKAIHKVMDEVERYVDHEKSADYWIPCSERLPRTGDDILVTFSDGEVDIIISARPKAWVQYEEANNLIFPVAWMPLRTTAHGERKAR